MTCAVRIYRVAVESIKLLISSDSLGQTGWEHSISKVQNRYKKTVSTTPQNGHKDKVSSADLH